MPNDNAATEPVTVCMSFDWSLSEECKAEHRAVFEADQRALAGVDQDASSLDNFRL